MISENVDGNSFSRFGGLADLMLGCGEGGYKFVTYEVLVAAGITGKEMENRDLKNTIIVL